ncbi:transferrin-binding protein-like solute binding protein [Uruburuella suis]|uniref:Transferrin binding protein n=1 Tax=Uruburuella suis TaxID=252130 RepID=A0AAE9H0A8_9NEIS|nr:transferrin-binding protein-like solute binding protein [Uruburuella suis]TCP02831.1 transferrin binding protein [Uruburuella suis]UOO78594.1 transferrin-binding protein-like solute binding protein [Uruburuella suis]
MNVLKWSLLAASLGLAACSSGGSNPPVVTDPGDGGGNPPVVIPDPGDGSGNPPVVIPDPGDGGGNPPVVVPDPGDGGGNPPVVTEPENGGMDKKISGEFYEVDVFRQYDVAPAYDPIGPVWVRNTGSTDNINILVLDGERINMLPQSITGNITVFSGHNEHGQPITKAVSNNMQYLVHGWFYRPTAAPCGADDINCQFDRESVSGKGFDPNAHRQSFFAQGYRTLDMPTSGTAAYSGQALVADARSRSTGIIQADITQTDASFSVDFGARTLTGKIGSFQPFTASIQGNRFATDDRDIPFDSYPISAKGGFYGPKAAELGGVFTDNRFAIGSFAAKQDASE